jgi:hypothetical protein
MLIKVFRNFPDCHWASAGIVPSVRVVTGSFSVSHDSVFTVIESVGAMYSLSFIA